MPTNILRKSFDEMLALCEEWERRLPGQDCRPKPHCECNCYEHRAHRAALHARAALEREKVCDG